MSSFDFVLRAGYDISKIESLDISDHSKKIAIKAIKEDATENTLRAFEGDKYHVFDELLRIISVKDYEVAVKKKVIIPAKRRMNGETKEYLKQQICDLLFDHDAYRDGKEMNSRPNQAIPSHRIADYLNVKKTTLSPILSQLVKEQRLGSIVKQGYFAIV